MSAKKQIPMVKAVYVSTNSSRHPVHGPTKAVLGRAIDYGWRRNGEAFNVAEVDIIARPDMFIAYPCQEPFIIKNGKILVPCGVEEVSDGFDTLEDIPGVGPSTAEKLVDLGLYTPDDVLTKADEGILKQLPAMSRKKVAQWQIDQA